MVSRGVTLWSPIPGKTRWTSRGGSGGPARGLPPRPPPSIASRNLPPRARAHASKLTVRVQLAAAAGAGLARPQEAGPPRRPRAHAEEPERPAARLRHRLQQRPERGGGGGGAEAGDGRAQGAGRTAQQRQHRGGGADTCGRGRPGPRRPGPRAPPEVPPRPGPTSAPSVCKPEAPGRGRALCWRPAAMRELNFSAESAGLRLGCKASCLFSGGCLRSLNVHPLFSEHARLSAAPGNTRLPLPPAQRPAGLRGHLP